jgi:polysaccharide export outer membrane protein
MTASFLPLFLFLAQNFSPAAPPATPTAAPPAGLESVENQSPARYVIGPSDELVIRAINIDEFDGKPARVDTLGDIDLPLIGRLHAAGKTLEEFEQVIENHLKKYLNAPDVTVSLAELRSLPVSVLGSVAIPGVQQLQGEKTLFEVLSLAGGLRADAGNLVKITRRIDWGPIPLPDAATDSTGQFSAASVSVKSIMAGTSPQENIVVKPYDVISVPRADIIYVIGAVKKSGGFVMGDNMSLSALQVLSLAEGLDKAAAPQSAKIMRVVEGTNNRSEIPVDLKKVLAGKGGDLPLKADDILFIPTSAAKSAALRTFEAAVQIGTGIAIYSR